MIEEFTADYYLGKLRALHPRLQALVNKNEQQLKESKENFNVFACLTKHHREELHTKMFRYLLNPKEAHNCRSSFLRQFMQVLKEDNQLMRTGLLPDIPETDLEDAQVETKDKYSEDYGKMDIFIETKTAIVVIENKVRAGEQDDQIFRYVSYCEESKKDFIVLYLTLNGISSKQAGNKPYYPISYRTHVCKWLEGCIELFQNYEMISVGLRYYLRTLEKNVLNLSENNLTMRLKELLLEEENKILINYLPELYNVLVPLRNHLRLQFFLKVRDRLNSKGYQIVVINRIVGTIDVNLIWDEMYRGFRITNREFRFTSEKGKSLDFCIEHDWNNLYFGLVVTEGSPVNVDFETDKDLKEIYDKLNEELNHELKSEAGCWTALRYTSICARDKFADDGLNYMFATEMEKLVNVFIEEAEEYLQALKRIVS